MLEKDRSVKKKKRLKFGKEMVEDGHISNSYIYGPAPYYLENVNNKNDCCNNNDSCMIMAEDREGSSFESVDESRTCALSDDRKLTSITNVPINNPTTITSVAFSTPTVKLPPMAKPSYSTSTGNCVDACVTTTRTTNSKTVRISPPFDKPYCPESNGSSHIEHSASQRFFDVTKDAESGDVQISCDRNFPPEIHKTVVAFGILIFNFFLTTTSLAIIHDKVPDDGPLPDTVLNAFAAKNWALAVSEVLIILTTSIMLLVIMSHRHRFIILRRLFLMLSLLYFMRSITMFVTVLPVSSRSYQCSDKKADPTATEILGRSFKLFFGMGLTINGQHVYCGDYIYSGHTTILVMTYLMISEYSPKRIGWLHWITWFMSFTGVLMVLLSHSHYTVDVIIGYFVTTRLFWMYHTCANNVILKKKSRYNYLSREWWFFLFQYFESNVKGPLQPPGYR